MGLGKIESACKSLLKRLGILAADGTYSGSSLSGLGSTDRAIPVTDGTGGNALQGTSVTITSGGDVVTAASAGVVIGGATTSGVRLAVASGDVEVREGDDSARTGLRALRVLAQDNSSVSQVDLNSVSRLVGLADTGALAWSSTTSAAGTKDTGLKRASAGDVRATDGSTGVGSMSAFVFNTTDGTNAQASVINSGGGRVKVGSGGGVHWSSTAAAAGSSDTALVRPEAKAVQPTDASTGNGYFYLGEVASAPTGTANVAKLYAVDNGAGKTQLVVIFGSGAAQVLATEP